MKNIEKLKQLTEVIDKVYEFNRQLIEAINTSHEGIALLDADGNYTWMNTAHETMFGYDKDELLGKSWTTIYTDADVEWFRTNVFPTIHKNGKWSGRATAIKKDGVTQVNEMVYLTALPNGGLICTCRDLDEEIY
jgi:PAS domain S-box-containing protein